MNALKRFFRSLTVEHSALQKKDQILRWSVVGLSVIMFAVEIGLSGYMISNSVSCIKALLKSNVTGDLKAFLGLSCKDSSNTEQVASKFILSMIIALFQLFTFLLAFFGALCRMPILLNFFIHTGVGYLATVALTFGLHFTSKKRKKNDTLFGFLKDQASVVMPVEVGLYVVNTVLCGILTVWLEKRKQNFFKIEKEKKELKSADEKQVKEVGKELPEEPKKPEPEPETLTGEMHPFMDSSRMLLLTLELFATVMGLLQVVFVLIILFSRLGTCYGGCSFNDTCVIKCSTIYDDTDDTATASPLALSILLILSIFFVASHALGVFAARQIDQTALWWFYVLVYCDTSVDIARAAKGHIEIVPFALLTRYYEAGVVELGVKVTSVTLAKMLLYYMRWYVPKGKKQHNIYRVLS